MILHKEAGSLTNQVDGGRHGDSPAPRDETQRSNSLMFFDLFCFLRAAASNRAVLGKNRFQNTFFSETADVPPPMHCQRARSRSAKPLTAPEVTRKTLIHVYARVRTCTHVKAREAVAELQNRPRLAQATQGAEKLFGCLRLPVLEVESAELDALWF